MGENKNADDPTPPAGELSVEDEKGLLEQTVFPDDEYELPEQTAEDIYKDQEPTA